LAANFEMMLERLPFLRPDPSDRKQILNPAERSMPLAIRHNAAGQLRPNTRKFLEILQRSLIDVDHEARRLGRIPRLLGRNCAIRHMEGCPNQQRGNN